MDAGVSVVAGFDVDEHCRYPYETNNPGAKFFAKDVATVSGAELKRLWSTGTIRLLAGCAPCQPFSSAAHSTRDGNDEDPRYPLLEHFSRLVKTCRPELVTMENVPSVKKHKPFLEFVDTLKLFGYAVWFKSVSCEKFGVPQQRRRMVLLASRLGAAPTLEPPLITGPTTVANALKGLTKLAAGERDSSDPIHFARSLTPINLRRLKHSKPGGSWTDWPEELRATCHTRPTGSSYKSVYARMRADAPSPTMTTQFFNFGTGRFGHPVEDRAITPREAALLQSFPRSYKFVAPEEEVTFIRLGKMIGNAVPPKLGEAIGHAFRSHMDAVQRKPHKRSTKL